MKWSTQKSIMFEAGMIKLCSNEIGSGNNIEERLEKIENYLKSGKVSMQQVVSNPVMQNANNSSVTRVIANENDNKTIQVSAPAVRTSNNNAKSYSSDLNKSWPKIVNDLKQNGKIVLYTNLINTKAEQINDKTVEIKFQRGITAFGKAVLEKQENVKEISNLVSMACGKDMQIKYISDVQNQVVKHNPEDDIQKLALDSDIPFNVIE